MLLTRLKWSSSLIRQLASEAATDCHSILSSSCWTILGWGSTVCRLRTSSSSVINLRNMLEQVRLIYTNPWVYKSYSLFNSASRSTGVTGSTGTTWDTGVGSSGLYFITGSNECYRISTMRGNCKPEAYHALRDLEQNQAKRQAFQ